MLVVHHLGRSQSERVVWLCEELGIPYELKVHGRDPVTMLAPPELKALHPMEAAPVIEDGGLVLAESGAIVEYIIGVHGGGRLAVAPGAPNYADYLYWLHFTNATLQAALGRNMILRRLDVEAANPVAAAMKGRLDRALALVERRLGEAPYLAGAELSAADIMIVFCLTTMRLFTPFDLGPYGNVRAYLQRIGARPAYRRAMEKGDPDMVPMLD